MAERTTIISIDSLVAILREYMPVEDAPDDMVAHKLMINPQQKNAIGIEVMSNEWQGYQGEQIVDFDLKRVFKV